jgi:HlyD family secretion protein
LAQIARADGQVSETGLQILTIDQGIRSDAQKELREIEARVAELAERKIAADDQLRRVDMRAPHAGIVHELAVHTVGAVIAPGETVMTIVPSGEVLEVEIKIAPADIDQVAAGQQAMLRFSAFNQRTTAEVPGAVSRVSADLTHDPRLGTSYYVGQIEVSSEVISKIDSIKLIPGMPVEVFIETGQRTALAYFTKPLTDQFARAFREN